MSNAKQASKDEAELAREIRLKLTDPTDEEMKQIGIIFDRLLASRGITRRDWIEVHPKNFHDSALSHMLAGRRTSKEVGRAVCDYIISAAD